MLRAIYNIFLGAALAFTLGSCATQGYINIDDPDVMYSRAMKFYGQEKWGKASRYFENVARMYIGTAREDSIMFLNAKCKFKNSDWHSAITYLESYRYQFSRSKFLEDAEGMLVLSYYYISPGPQRDPTNILQTLSSIEEFESRYPKNEANKSFAEIKKELIQRLYDRSFLNAYTYYKTGHYKSAIAAFRNALREYPNNPNREKTMYYMNLAGYELARNSITSLEVDRYMALVDMYYSFIAEFPESPYRKELDQIVEAANKFLEKSNIEE